MKEKPPKKKPKKVKSGLSQKERFIEYAKELEVDETGGEFEKALKNIAKKKGK